MPSLFVSHGAPTFALEPGDIGATLKELGHRYQNIEAIVVMSPHWMTRGLVIGANETPETIHDFGGFPKALYTLQYPARGSNPIALRVKACLEAAGFAPSVDPKRGLDHGVWVPLMHLFPEAQIPVVPVSMPQGLDAPMAYRLGEALRPLGQENILILGSGSLTHNLYEFTGDDSAPEATYVTEFKAWVREVLAGSDQTKITRYLEEAPHARRAHPTPDHFVPLPFAVGSHGGVPQILTGKTRYGMLSMESYLFA